jgi:ATP-dependent Clp protease ATP-binding subunit ClpB
MNFEKFTIKAQEALARSQVLASEYGHQTIEDFHLMSALLEQKEGIILPVLKKLEVNIDDFSNEVSSLIAGFPKVSGQNVQIYMSHGLTIILNNAFSCNKQWKNRGALKKIWSNKR